MALVEVDISISVDGFVTGPNLKEYPGLGEGGEILHAWLGEPEGQQILHESFAAAGAVITSRKVFDGTGGWGDEPPYHMPVFVVTHRPHEVVVRGETTFTFVTGGIEDAIAQASAVAGDKTVYVMGGASIIQQALEADLVDQVFLHVAPVLLGGGTPLFGQLGKRIELERVEAGRDTLHHPPQVPRYEEASMTDVHTLMTGIAFGESPRWHENRLWFADWEAQELIAVDQAGNSEVVLHVASFPFSIDWLPNGGLLIVSAHDRKLLRREPDGSLVTHTDLTRLSRSPWNEIVVDGRGNIYLNNIGFDFPGGEFAPGIVALVTSDGTLRQVADGVAFPNGMAVTPDNATLILAESYANRLTAFDIAADGSLTNRRVWAETGDDHPDGICLDAEGAVWYGDVGNQRCVRVREGGEVLQEIELDRGCFACMLGGADRRTLFMVAREWGGVESTANGERTGQILIAQAPAPGAGWP